MAGVYRRNGNGRMITISVYDPIHSIYRVYYNQYNIQFYTAQTTYKIIQKFDLVRVDL